MDYSDYLLQVCILVVVVVSGIGRNCPAAETVGKDASCTKQTPDNNAAHTRTPYLEIPKYAAGGGSGRYTGFNSVNLQEIYVVQKQGAIRSQISPRGGHKPCFARLPNGDLLATQISNGNVALCRSKDDGFSWGRARDVIIPEVGKLRGRAAQFSALVDGTLLLAVARGKPYRSTDGGRTWQQSRINWSVTIENENRDDFIFGESDGFQSLADGTAICSVYIALAPGKVKAYLLRSKDAGQTWSDGSYIADASEVNIAILPDGKMLGCLRVASGGAGEGGAVVAVTESNDGGRTWTQPRRIEGLGRAQIPGFPLYLKDGRVLIVYGNRQFPFGVQAIASRDGGKTWDTKNPIILAWFSWDNYCGHPRSLLLPDGSIITGYYARVFKEQSPNTDVVGHCLRWRAPDDWPPMR